MIKKLFKPLFLTSIILTSCIHGDIFGIHTFGDPEPIINSSVSPFVKEFIMLATLYGYSLDTTNLVIEVRDFPTSEDDPDFDQATVGLCFYPNFLQGPYIILRKDYWIHVNPTLRKVLIFHELGHCLLERDHDENMKADVLTQQIRPTSIMYPYVLETSDFNTHEMEYIDELFTKVPQEFKIKHLNFKVLQFPRPIIPLWYNFKELTLFKGE